MTQAIHRGPFGYVKKIVDIKPEDITINDLRHLSNDSFPMWTQTSGVKIDGNNIDFNDHRYLLPIYMNNEDELVWRKAAQLGASSWMFLKTIWWLYTHPGRKAGIYVPNESLAQNMSKDRLLPLLRSIEHIIPFNKDDKLGLRRINDASLYMFALGGVSSRDSVPLDFISFDEVRLCKDQDIDQTLERISHSQYKIKSFLSTCGLPADNIDRRFTGGSQLTWHSFCNCPDGCDLPATFPDCVVDDKKRGKLYLRCPKCKYVIHDAQNGRYVPHNPGAAYTSFSVSQLASKYISLKEIWDVYHRTTNKAEFMNAKLGLPYVDEQNRGVTQQQLERCVDKSLSWIKPEQKDKPTAMGVDVGGGYVYVTIMDTDGNKKRIRHVEIIESSNPKYMENGKQVSPFRHLRRLIKDYNVQICVIDSMPNYDMVLEFAQELPGKVFAAFYTESKDLVAWSDKPKVKLTQRKAGPHLRFKHYALISKYLALDFTLGDLAKNNIIYPDPDKLVATVLDPKLKSPTQEAIMRRYEQMYLRLIRNFHITNEETNEGRYQWIFAGGPSQDPHAAHSLLYANVALERMRRQLHFLFS